MDRPTCGILLNGYTMHELNITVPGTAESQYTITIGGGLLGSLWTRMKTNFHERRLFVVTDASLVKAGHLDTLLDGRTVPHFVVDPPGEISKNISTAVAIVEAMEAAYLGRDTVVVALGGGTVGDMAGFAAAIFKRGVPVVQVPTTTLAQADSAVGGKTGVDSTVSKNAFGAFWHPAVVYVDVETLKSLDERQFRAGLVESVKHAVIADAAYFEFLESNLDAILSRQNEVLETIAKYNCTIKGRVVEADPLERNQRRMLNYGHTVGHAVESASHFDLLHGEAIAIGMIAAGLIEVEMGLSEPARLDRIAAILRKLNVPIELPSGMDTDKVIDILKHDKKAVDKWPKFVLTTDFGQVHRVDGQYAVDVKRDVVEQVLTKLRGN